MRLCFKISGAVSLLPATLVIGRRDFSIHAVFVCARDLRNFTFDIMNDPSEQTPIKKRLRHMKQRSQTPQLVKQLTRVKRVRTGKFNNAKFPTKTF